MTEQNPAQTSEQQPKPGEQPKPDDGKQPPWGDAANFDPQKAWDLIQNLRRERGGDSSAEFRQQLEQMQAAQTAQREALAKALGVAPEQVSDTQRLTDQVNGLQQQVLASQRAALAAQHGVPEGLLTAATRDEMATQAQALVEFAQGAHYAAAQAATQATPPAFQQNPGQGQGGSPTPEAQADAEYETYYPPTPTR